MARARQLAFAVACAIGIGAGGNAFAAPCYVVLDRTDVVIYRDVVPPIDLSDDKSPERAAMRQRGEHLIIAEFEKCEPAGFISATTGGTTATVEDIVTQLKPAIAPSVGSRQGAAGGTTGAPGTGSAAAGKAGTASTSRAAPAPAKKY
jgi:hypothetical protein